MLVLKGFRGPSGGNRGLDRQRTNLIPGPRAQAQSRYAVASRLSGGYLVRNTPEPIGAAGEARARRSTGSVYRLAAFTRRFALSLGDVTDPRYCSAIT
jgi:hypothetical protein